jgi:hypothetical protein
MQNYLKEQLERIIATSFYPINFSGDIPNFINRWLVRAVPVAAAEFDRLDPYFQDILGEILFEAERMTLGEEVCERNWRYYISEEKNTFYQANAPQKLFAKDRDKYIYALSSVYCNEKRPIVVYANGITPIRMWINGRLVLTNSFHYHVKPYLFIFNFEQGLNTVLIEKSLFIKDLSLGIEPDHFTIALKPVQYLTNPELNYFADPGMLEDLENSYTIIPERAFLGPGQKIQWIVLPGCFDEAGPEAVQIRIFNGNQELLACLTVDSERVVSVAVPDTQNGVLHLTAASLTHPAKTGEVYFFYGRWKEKLEGVTAAARSRRDCNEVLVDSITALTGIADADSGCIKNFPQTVQDRLYHQIFEKLFEFEGYMNRPDGPGPVECFEIFKDNAYLVKKNRIDGGFIHYSIFLPENYDPLGKYPLVINVQFGYGMFAYPLVQRYAQKRRFHEAIIMNITGRGNLNRDYIHEANLFELFEEVIEKYHIDRERVYIIGSCTGTMKGFGMALRRPGLFAVVAGVNGMIRLDLKTPNPAGLKNLQNTMAYKITNIEDHGFDCSSSRAIRIFEHLDRLKSWNVTQFGHDDLDEFLNQGKLFRELLAEKRNKYPRGLEFHVDEPVYNRCFWLRVDYITELGQTAVIKATIESRGRMEIQTENISCFSIFVDAAAMELDRLIEFSINQKKLKLQVPEFSIVRFNLADPETSAQISACPEEEYHREYERLRVDEELMGIKQVYYNQCLIIKSDIYQEHSKGFARKLFYILQAPLKERFRGYHYPALWENQLALDTLGAGNFIYVMDAGNLSEMQRKVLELLGLRADASRLVFGGNTFDGAYFALIKRKNPFGTGEGELPGHQCLIILLNQDSLEDELLRFLNSFDTDGRFYNDAIIFAHSRYHCFRDRLNIIKEIKRLV